MKKILLILLLICCIKIEAQEIKNYTWDEKPTFETIPEKYKNQPAVVLFDKRWIHTRIGNYSFASFVMNHFAIKINSATEINKYNKVKAEDNGYIRDLRDFHARVIKPNGDIKIIPKEKIVEAEIEKVKSIVFEGVEAGDVLEYYFILKENPTSYALDIYQKEIPVLFAEFKATNSGAEFFTVASPEFDNLSKRNDLLYQAKNLEPYKEENNAKNFKNIAKIIYNLNSSGSASYQYWPSLMKLRFAKPSFEYFKKNQAREFIENLELDRLTTDEKILKLDKHIKTYFDFVWKGEKPKKISDLNDGKLKLNANEIFGLYGFIFKELEIPYQIVVATDRYVADINPDRLVYPIPHEFMYYIPETKKFVSPYEKYLSYGNPMYEIQGTSAIAYDPQNKREPISRLSIPVMPADYTVMESQIEVSLSNDLTTTNIEKTSLNSGYVGQLERNWTKYIKENEDDKKMTEYIKDRLFDGIDVKLLEHHFENGEFKYNYNNTPFITKTKATSKESIVEDAGNLTIVNIGKVIGKQTNLYQENERKYDIDLYYAKTFKTTIVFQIPDGYVVESMNDLIQDKKFITPNKEELSFKSSAKVEGNKLIISLLEIYGGHHFPKETYPEYRKIINASADFVKATVVLKAKK